MQSKIELINNATEKAINKVKGYAKPKTIISIIQIVACFILTCGIYFVSYNFDFSKFKTASFYISILCSMVSVILIFRATVNARFDKTANRDSVLKAKKEYNDHNKNKKQDLKIFLKEFNLNTKIEYYVSNINSKIFKIEKKLIKCKNGNKILKLEESIEKLKNYITTEYINDHIDRINIKYPIVYFSDFNELENSITHKILTKENYNQELNKKTFSNVLSFIFISILLGIGISNGYDGNVISLVVNIIWNIIMCICRVASALMQADVIYDSTITKSLLDRTDILIQYENWRLNNPDELQKYLENKTKEYKEIIKKEYEEKAQKVISRYTAN